MTSAQTMLTRARAALSSAVLLVVASACSFDQRPPRETLTAPYAIEQLWAVVPPTNETGVSQVDTARVADMIAQQLQAVNGVNALPVNRVLLAMEQAGIESVATTAQVQAMMDRLQVDGLIVGSLTAYDPYPPLTLGIALQLFVRTTAAAQPIDPAELSRITRGELAPGGSSTLLPAAQAAGIFDVRDQATLRSLRDYASHRHQPDTAYGADIYLVSMDLFAQFVSHRLIRDLLHRERSRVTRTAARSQAR